MENYKETVEKINETFTKGDTEGFLSYCADDVTWNKWKVSNLLYSVWMQWPPMVSMLPLKVT